MQASKLRTLWIIIASFALTGSICLQASIRQLLRRINRPWVNKTIFNYARRLLKLVDVNVKIINPHQVTLPTDKPTILMCNHSSLYDIPLSLLAWPNQSIRMLAKIEMSRWPIMGAGMHASEFPFIDRKNRHNTIKNLNAVQKLLKSGIIVWIAPEGTRSRDGTLQKFKKGGFITAIQTGATIIPMGIRGANLILSAKSHKFNLHQNAEVHIGLPIDTQKYSLENKQQLIDDVFAAMQPLVNNYNPALQ